MIITLSATIFAAGPGLPPGPPTVVWLANVQSPVQIEAGGKDILGIIDFYVMQPTIVLDVDMVVEKGKVNALSYSNLGELLPLGWNQIVITGTVPASVAKKGGYISWQIDGFDAVDTNDHPIQFLIGLPLWSASEVKK